MKNEKVLTPVSEIEQMVLEWKSRVEDTQDSSVKKFVLELIDVLEIPIMQAKGREIMHLSNAYVSGFSDGLGQSPENFNYDSGVYLRKTFKLDY